MPIIFITGHGDIPMTVRAMKAGAAEFLTKPLKDDVLVNAIRGALERSRAALRVDAELQTLRTCYDSLTPREREVMARVTAGMLNKQVGGDLGISEITVKAHRGQVMRKMKAESLPDLVTMAARLGLQPTPKASTSRHPLPRYRQYHRPIDPSSRAWCNRARDAGVPTHPSADTTGIPGCARAACGTWPSRRQGGGLGPLPHRLHRHLSRPQLLEERAAALHARARDRRLGGRGRNRSDEVPAW